MEGISVGFLYDCRLMDILDLGLLMTSNSRFFHISPICPYSDKRNIILLAILHDTYTADGTFYHAFKAHQLQCLVKDIFARGQNHEKKHHPPLPIASAFQVSCSMFIGKFQEAFDTLQQILSRSRPPFEKNTNGFFI